jgi:PIN domain nuclease of toxin-antitoxin system
MRFLVDTQLLIWAAYEEQKLSKEAYRLLNAENNEPCFSTVSLWEVALKRTRNYSDFQWDVGPLREGLLANGYAEIDLSGAHILAFGSTVPLHKDPFDRMLVAQAVCEGIVLLTADNELARHDGPIRLVA